MNFINCTAIVIPGTNIAGVQYGRHLSVYQVKGGWAVGPSFGPRRVKKQQRTGSPAVWAYLPMHLAGSPFMGRI
jgi:hypothetical protein